MQVAVQTINDIGQITLGSHLAGHQVTVEPRGDSAWFIQVTDSIPKDEKWLHEPGNREKLDSALRWASEHPATGANTDAILAQLSADR